MIENRLLKYFVMVARFANFTKAAEHLGIAQPTLTRQIQSLEKEIGKTLFTRGKRQVSLTEDGEYLLTRAKEILSLVEKTENSFRSEKEIIAGDISIGSGETATMRFIAGIFKEVQLEHPDIHFHIYSGNAEAIYKYLDEGIIDVGLTLGSNRSDRFDYFSLNSFDCFGILLRKEHRLAAKNTITLNELKDEKLIVSSQSSHAFEVDSVLSDIHDKFNVIATYNLIHNATYMVENSMGIALCLDNIVNIDENSPFKFIPLVPQVRVPSYLATKKFSTPSAATKCFLEKVKEKVGQPISR